MTKLIFGFALLLTSSAHAVGVNLRTGAAEWSYPLELPAGRGGSTPTFAIQYSSNGGQSAVGYGFSIADPSIRRSTEQGAPNWDDSDEFLLNGMPLVKVGSFAGAMEYRLLDDDADIQILRIQGAPDVWRVRTRDGSVQWFDLEITVYGSDIDVPFGSSADRVSGAVWKRTHSVDREGNQIDYTYTPSSAVPVLTKIAWGGNSRLNQAHVFELHLLRNGMGNPFRTEVRTPNDGAGNQCDRGKFPSYRYGFNFPEVGAELNALIFAAVVTTAAPGTTDGELFERQRRISRVYQFSYNWDRVGCNDFDNIWPLLEKIDTHAIDLAGNVTRAPTTTLAYNSWRREFTRAAGPKVPSSFSLDGAAEPRTRNNLPRQLSPYLSLSAPNFDRQAGLYHVSSRGCRMDYYSEWRTAVAAFSHVSSYLSMMVPGVSDAIVHAISAGVSMIDDDVWLASCRNNDNVGNGQMATLIDIRGDGKTQFVDLQECLRSGARASATPLAGTQFAPFATGLFGGVTHADGTSSVACGTSVGVRMASNEPPPGLGFRFPSVLPDSASLAGDWFSNTIERSQYRKIEGFFADMDGDGDQDVVTSEGYHPFDRATGTYLAVRPFGDTPWADLDYVWRHSPTDEGQIEYATLLSGFSSNDTIRKVRDRRFSPTLQNGRTALQLVQSYAHTSTPVTVAPYRFSLNLDGTSLVTATAEEEEIGTGVSYSSSVGDVRDYTGDGIADRLATVRNGDYVQLVLYRAIAPGHFADGLVVLQKHKSELDFERGEGLMPSASGNVTVGIARTPNSRTVPVVGDVQTDAIVDINGDGLPDLISADAKLIYDSRRSFTAGVQGSFNPFASLRGGSLTSGLNLRVTAAGVMVRSGSLALIENGLQVMYNRAGKRFGDALTRVDTNIYGQSYVGITAYERTEEFREGPCIAFGIQVNCVDSYGAIRTERRGSFADYNGDGLVDLIYPTHWRPNLGGSFGPAQALPPSLLASALYAGMMEVAIMDGRQAFSATKQTLIDVNNDGRVDVLAINDGPLVWDWLGFDASGTGGVYQQVYTTSTATDATLTPPGRLVSVSNGLGARTTITYKQVQVARNERASEQIDALMPRNGFVVAQIQNENVPYAQKATKSYEYFGERYLTDGLRPNAREGFAGYARVEECEQESGVLTKRHFSYSQVPRGLAEREEVFVDNTDFGLTLEWRFIDDTSPAVPLTVPVLKSCGKADKLLRVTQPTFATTELTAAAGRRYRRTLSVGTTTDSYLFSSVLGGSPTAQRYETPVRTATRTEYLPGTTLPSVVYADGDVFDSTDDKVVTYTYDVFTSDALYSSRLRSQTTTTADLGQVAKVQLTYDDNQRVKTKTTWASAAEPLTEQLGYDDFGNVTKHISPSGRTSVSCYDRFALYPIIAQGPDGSRIETVVDYATGQALETRGPVGLATTAVQCPTYDQEREPSFTPRRTDPIELDKVQREHVPNREVSVPQVTGFGGSGGGFSSPAMPPEFTEHPHSIDRLPTVTSAVRPLQRDRRGLWPSYVLEPHPLERDTATLPPPPSSARTFTAYTSQTIYDGLGRLLSTLGVSARNEDGTFVVVELARARYTTSSMGTRVSQWSSLATSGGLDLMNARESETATDAWGQTRQSWVAVERDASGALPRVNRQTLSYDDFGALATQAPSPTSDWLRVEQGIVARDGLLRPLTMRSADGQIATRSTSVSVTDGRLSVVSRTTDPEGMVEESANDPFGRPLWTRSYTQRGFGAVGDAIQTSFKSDSLGRVTQVTDADGQVHRMTYDWFGRVKTSELVSPLSGAPVKKRTFVYDLDGALVLEEDRDANGEAQVTAYVRDSASGRLLQKLNPAVSAPLPGFGSVFYTYILDAQQDGYGQVKRQCAPIGCVEMTYDGAQRVKTRDHKVDVMVGGSRLQDQYGFAFLYNVEGSVKKITFRTTPEHYSGTAAPPSFDFIYSNTGRLTDVFSGALQLAHMEHLLSGHMHTRTDAFGGTELRSFTLNGQLRNITLMTQGYGGPVTEWEQTLGYYRNGLPETSALRPRIETAYDEPTRTSRYGYDGAGRLKSVTGGWGYSNDVTYYRNGSRIDKVNENVLGNASMLTYRYDDPRFVTALTSQVNTTSGEARHTIAYRADGAISSFDSMPEKADPFGVVRQVGSEEALTDVDENRTHFFDGYGNLYATADGLLDIVYKKAGASFQRQSTERLASVSGQPFARVNDYGGVRLMHRDAQGSVVVSRGEPWAATYKFEYAPHGRLMRTRGYPGTNAERRGFHGALADVARPGVWVMGARDYRPDLMMWNAIDPAALSLVGDNHHRFANDNPLAFNDLSGLQSAPIVPIENSGVDQAPIQEATVRHRLNEGDGYQGFNRAFNRVGGMPTQPPQAYSVSAAYRRGWDQAAWERKNNLESKTYGDGPLEDLRYLLSSDEPYSPEGAQAYKNWQNTDDPTPITDVIPAGQWHNQLLALGQMAAGQPVAPILPGVTPRLPFARFQPRAPIATGPGVCATNSSRCLTARVAPLERPVTPAIAAATAALQGSGAPTVESVRALAAACAWPDCGQGAHRLAHQLQEAGHDARVYTVVTPPEVLSSVRSAIAAGQTPRYLPPFNHHAVAGVRVLMPDGTQQMRYFDTRFRVDAPNLLNVQTRAVGPYYPAILEITSPGVGGSPFMPTPLAPPVALEPLVPR
jgi:RHS repeat-associated protein